MIMSHEAMCYYLNSEFIIVFQPSELILYFFVSHYVHESLLSQFLFKFNIT